MIFSKADKIPDLEMTKDQSYFRRIPMLKKQISLESVSDYGKSILQYVWEHMNERLITGQNRL